jgi:hypothetical protein
MAQGLHGLVLGDQPFGALGAGGGVVENPPPPPGGNVDHPGGPGNPVDDMVLIADADAAQAVRVAEQATEIAALKARLALYEGDAPDGGDAPPPALFLDPTGLARVRAAAAATRGEDKKVELPDLVPGFKSSALDIGEHFSSPAGHSREAGGAVADAWWGVGWRSDA